MNPVNNLLARPTGRSRSALTPRFRAGTLGATLSCAALLLTGCWGKVAGDEELRTIEPTDDGGPECRPYAADCGASAECCSGLCWFSRSPDNVISGVCDNACARPGTIPNDLTCCGIDLEGDGTCACTHPGGTCWEDADCCDTDRGAFCYEERSVCIPKECNPELHPGQEPEYCFRNPEWYNRPPSE